MSVMVNAKQEVMDEQKSYSPEFQYTDFFRRINPCRVIPWRRKGNSRRGWAPEKWLIVKDTPEEMEVVSRIALQRKNGKTKVIRKAEK